MVILYLLTFLSPREVAETSMDELKSMRSGIAFIDSTIKNYLYDYQGPGDCLFSYPNGRRLTASHIETILIRACKAQGIQYRGIEAFQALIRGRAGQ